MNIDEIKQKISIAKNVPIENIDIKKSKGRIILVKNYLGNYIKYASLQCLIKSKYDSVIYNSEAKIVKVVSSALNVKPDEVSVLEWDNGVFKIKITDTVIVRKSFPLWMSLLLCRTLPVCNPTEYGDGNRFELTNYANYGKKDKAKYRIYRCLKHPKYTWTRHSKKGCPICSGKVVDRTSFIAKSIAVHKNKYTEFGEYTAYNDKILIKCPIHGWFNQLVSSHIKGSGCQLCAIENRMKKRR